MPDNSSSNKRIAKNTLFLYIRMAFVLIVSLYTTRVVLKVLGVDDYGVFNVVCGFVSMFGFLNTSMSNAIQRFYNFEIGKNGGKELTAVYNCSLLIQVLLAIAIIIVVESFGLWYLNNRLVITPDRLPAARLIFQFAIIQMMFLVVQIPYSAAIMAFEKMDYYALVSIIDVLIKLGVVLVLPYIPLDKLIFYGLFLVLISLTNFLLYFVYAKRHFKQIKWHRDISKDRLISILSFSGWNIMGSFAYVVKNQGSAVVLNRFFGTVLNAAYGVSNQVMAAIKQFSTNIIISFRPQLVQSYAEGNYSRTKNLMFSMSKITYLLMLAISLPLIVEMKYVLGFWLGEIPPYTVSLTILAIISMLLSNFNTPVVQVVHAVGKMKKFQIATSLIICSIVPLAWLAFRLGGNPCFVFYVTIGIVCINQIVCLIILHSMFDYSYKEYLSQVILPCFFVTALTPILPYLLTVWMSESFFRLVLVCVLSILIIVPLAYYLALTKPEKEMVKQFVNKVLHKNKKPS